MSSQTKTTHTPDYAAEGATPESRQPQSMVGNTKGPWEFRSVYGANGNLIALLLETRAYAAPHDPCVLAVREDWLWYLLNTPEGQARLRLIASAPELLGALENLLLEPDSQTNREAARAAIEKAEGRP